jgi:hypothetical protein
MMQRGLALVLGSMFAVTSLGCGGDGGKKPVDDQDASAGTGGSGGAGGSSGGSGGNGGSGGAGGSGAGTGGTGGASADAGESKGDAGDISADGGGDPSDGARTDVAAADAAAGDGPATSRDGRGAHPMMTFFVTSTGSGSMGGNLGGLAAADMKCKMLAAAVGAGDKQWVAWLSVEKGADGKPVHAKDRVGKGPWHDSKGRLIAQDLKGLLPGPNMRPVGDAAAVNDLLDEKGNPVTRTPRTTHDILTGTKADGTVATGLNCKDWTSSSGTDRAQLGHSDNMGPADRRSWTEAHASQNCTMAGVAAGGGNGRIYCLAVSK